MAFFLSKRSLLAVCYFDNLTRFEWISKFEFQTFASNPRMSNERINIYRTITVLVLTQENDHAKYAKFPSTKLVVKNFRF